MQMGKKLNDSSNLALALEEIWTSLLQLQAFAENGDYD
ncbi:hypothetical protein Vi05172_g6976 [Venturia inaequalis]|nr:hypothetical protein Vi05172_g6976 [Venturia inaequalis]